MYEDREFIVPPGDALTGFYSYVERDNDPHLMLLGLVTEPDNPVDKGEGDSEGKGDEPDNEDKV